MCVIELPTVFNGNSSVNSAKKKAEKLDDF